MELVWVAVINGMFALLILLLGRRLNGKINRMSSVVHETKDEVKNSHEVNFRDDMDSKFQMTNSLIRGVQETQARQGRDIIDLRTTMSDHVDASAARDREVREELVAFRETLRGE